MNQAVGTARPQSLTGRQQLISERRGRRTGLAANPTPPRAAANKSKIYDPRLQIAFPVVRRTSDELRAALSERLAPSAVFPGGARIEVAVEDRTAILRGEVAERQDAVLAELLVRFEPGVDSVRNELTVAPVPPRQDSLPFPDSESMIPQ
jgi:osmotically-inducible protein OsmY